MTRSKSKVLEDHDDTRQHPIETAVILREKAVHAAFARSRTVDFVYSETADYMNVLDGVCCSESISMQRPPLVVTGPPCSGKSALLAHWARKFSQREDAPTIFQHYAGASHESVKLSLFLYRLLHSLKTNFELRDFELPQEHDEEKLKFSLARCLEAAMGIRPKVVTEKGKNLVILIDGIDNLRTEDGSERITWLPNTLPVGVQIIASATVQSVTELPSCLDVERDSFDYDSDNEIVVPETTSSDENDTHIIQELKRRKYLFLKIDRLDQGACQKLISDYNDSVSEDRRVRDDWIPRIIDTKGSGCPFYMRLLLTTISDPHISNREDCFDECLAQSEIAGMFQVKMKYWNLALTKDLSSVAFPASHPDKEMRPIKNKKKATGKPKELQSLVLTQSDAGKHRQVETTRKLLMRHVLSLLYVTRHGLSKKDIRIMLEDSVPLNIRQLMWDLIRPHLLEIERQDCAETLYSLSHNPCRLFVRNAFLHDESLLSNYHKEVAKYFEKMKACQRRVDELPVHLEFCMQWPGLLSCLVDIKMFQLWWTDVNREDYISYWVVFRNYCSNSDPVEEFIHALDEYSDTESSNSEALLHLLLEITSFLRRWQQNSNAKCSPELNRPAAPTLQDLLSFHSPFSTYDFKCKEVDTILAAFQMLSTDAYTVRRWLWSQFPLIAVAFERRFLTPVFKQRGKGDDEAALDSITMAPKKKKEKQKAKARKHATGVQLPPPSMDRIEAAIKSASLFRSGNKRNFVVKPDPNVDSGSLEFLSMNNEGSQITIPTLKQQIQDLRQQLDKIVFMKKEKMVEMDKLDSRLADAVAGSSQRDQEAKKQEETVERMRQAIRRTVEGKLRTQYYKLILRLCEVYPSKDPNIIEETEKKVRTMKQEIIELKQKAQVIGYERKLASIEIPKLMIAICEKEKMHKQALSRLQWRHIQSVRQHNWEMKFRMKSKEMKAQATGDLGEEEEAMMLERMADRVTAEKKIKELKRQNLAKLQEFEGSAEGDKGLLGLLYSVGIREPGEMLPRWEDMVSHQEQLAIEICERELDIQKRKETLINVYNDLQRVKLGGADESSDTAKPKTSNTKKLEQSIQAEQRTLHQKTVRAERANELYKNLQLGLEHILLLLGKQVTPSEGAISRLEQVDLGIRRLIGEDTNQAGSLRRKASMRFGPNNTHRNAEQKAKFNVRVGILKEDLSKADQESIKAMKLQCDEDFNEIRSNIKHTSKQEVDKRRLHQRKIEAKLAQGAK